jgi:hypothetical protein
MTDTYYLIEARTVRPLRVKFVARATPGMKGIPERIEGSALEMLLGRGLRREEYTLDATCIREDETGILDVVDLRTEQEKTR